MNSLGSKLKDLRTSHSLTMEQLADKLNARYNSKINKGMLSKWENNLGEPSLENMRILANFYKVSLDFLLNIETQNTERMLKNRKKELKSSIDDTTIKLDKNSSVNKEVLGQLLKQRREALGLSQDELAMRLNYKSRSTIAKIESGANDIPQSKIKAFADALNTTPAYLMGWVDNKEIIKQDPETTVSKNESKLLTNYNNLNDVGKKKLLEYSEDLAGNTNYMNPSITCELSATLDSKDYLKPIAAHNDNINDGELEKINRDIERLRAKARTKRNK